MANQGFSPENKSKSYFEECVLRKLLTNETDARDVLRTANSRGYTIEKIRQIADQIKTAGWMTEEQCDETVEAIRNERPVEFNESNSSHRLVTEDETGQEDSCLGDLVIKKTEFHMSLEDIRKTFSPSQEQAFNWLEMSMSQKPNSSILAAIVGQAGTGKSYLIQALEQHTSQHKIVLKKLATTGVAAYLIKGQTIHSFLKMDIECHSFLEPGLMEYQAVLDSQMIIIDEFGMLEMKVFLALDKLLRKIAIGKNHAKPFGGRHVILTGDPCQLPAIEKDIFGSYLWEKFEVMVLKDVHRQKDPRLMQILNEVRFGYISEPSEELLKSRIISDNDIQKLDPHDTTIIVSTRDERDKWNGIMLNKVEGEEYVFEAQDTDSTGKPLSDVEKERLKKYHRERLPDKLILKIGAKVLLTKNLDVENGWTNGTMATVIAITGDCIILEHVTTKKRRAIGRVMQQLVIRGGIYTIIRCQLPCILGFAITTHKCQGMTLNKAYILLNKNFFASGQAYTALSRVRCLDDLFLLAYDREAIIMTDRVKWIMKDIIYKDILKSDKHIPEILNTITSSANTGKKRKLQTKDKSSAKIHKVNAFDSSSSIPTVHQTLPTSDILSRNCFDPPLPTITPHAAMPTILPSGDIIPSTGRERHRVSGTGDCFYKCLSYNLYGKEDYHLKIREVVCNVLHQHPESFIQFYDNTNEEEFIDHIIQQQSPGAWATQVEIFAAATWLQCPLFIYMMQQGLGSWLLHEPVYPCTPPSSMACNIYITLINESNVHYNVLLPINGMCNCQVEPPTLEGIQVSQTLSITSEE